jgi:hypothetical protein
MRSFQTSLVALALSLGLGAAPALAQDGTAFLAKLGGTWNGGGKVAADRASPAGATSCRLTGSPSGVQVTITGVCDGAARGAQFSVVLRWSDPTKEFVGTFQGGAESGTATLSGKLSGNTLSMRVTSRDGTTSSMSLTLSGNDQVTLRVTGKDNDGKPAEFVSIALRKA